jgi:hypothetical protein
MLTFFVTTALVLWKAHLCEAAWNTDYGYAIKYVRSHDKPLVILFDVLSPEAGEWDQATVFDDQRLDHDLTAEYIRLFVDLQGESGRQLAAEFGVTQYPSLVVVDRSGDWQVYRRSGYHSADELQSVLNRFRRAKLVSGTTLFGTGATTIPVPPTAASCRT